MKKIIYSITFFCITNLILAQNPILNIHTEDFADIENAYYKDSDNFYNQFIGTWIYTDAFKTIRFRFVKREMFYRQSVKNCYVDYLIGEMQYIENGVEKINSLSNLNNSHTEIFEYSIYSYGKAHFSSYPKCVECPENVQRISMRYNEPTNDDVGLDAAFIIRRADENGVQKIKIQYILTNGALGVKDDWQTPSTTTNFTIPYGDYTFVREQ